MSSDSKTFNINHHIELFTKKTGLNGKVIFYLVSGGIVLSLISLLSYHITALVGIVIPGIMSLKALETSELDDDKQWLTYWVVYGVFSLLDIFLGFVLKLIPFYYFIKLLFLFWCFSPHFKGAFVIYQKVLVPLFKKYGKKCSKIQEIYEKGSSQIKETYEKNKEKIKDAIGEKVQEKLGEIIDGEKEKFM